VVEAQTGLEGQHPCIAPKARLLAGGRLANAAEGGEYGGREREPDE